VIDMPNALQFFVILDGVHRLVNSIRSHRSDLSKAVDILLSEEKALVEFSPYVTIPSLIRITSEMQLWTRVCLSSLLLSRLCVGLRLNREIKQQAIEAIIAAYEPAQGEDNGATSTVKLLSLAGLGFPPAMQTIELIAEQMGVNVQQVATSIFTSAIQAVAESHD